MTNLTSLGADSLSRRNLGIAALVLAVAMVLVFGDVLTAGDAKLLSTETSDIATQELGRHLFNYGQLAKGNFPLWCRSGIMRISRVRWNADWADLSAQLSILDPFGGEGDQLELRPP